MAKITFYSAFPADLQIYRDEYYRKVEKAKLEPLVDLVYVNNKTSKRKGLVAGIGVNDVEDSTFMPIYAKWNSMLNRCKASGLTASQKKAILGYDSNGRKLSRAERDEEEAKLAKALGVEPYTICDEWKIFSNFYKWCYNKYYSGLHMVIYPKGCRHYSPTTVMFLEKADMMKLKFIREQGWPNHHLGQLLSIELAEYLKTESSAK